MMEERSRACGRVIRAETLAAIFFPLQALPFKLENWRMIGKWRLATAKNWSFAFRRQSKRFDTNVSSDATLFLHSHSNLVPNFPALRDRHFISPQAFLQS
jgi:hypothetical protein